jgi:hypothetical protein
MTLRVLVPLLTILAALAWGATSLVNGTTRSWFERDVSLRARLVASGAREALAHVSELNVYRWAGRMLADAARLGKRDRLSSRLSIGIHPVEEARR